MLSQPKTDFELIAEFRSGKISSYEELIGRYSAKAYSLATRLTRCEHDAEEVLQDVFVTVYHKIGKFQGKSSFSSWLYRVTVNSALMKLRKRRQERNLYLEEIEPHMQDAIMRRHSSALEADAAVKRAELLSEIEQALKFLPLDYRPVFVLKDIDGLSSKEVGKILNLTIPAVKSRLHRSRLILRRKLSHMIGLESEDAASRKTGNLA